MNKRFWMLLALVAGLLTWPATAQALIWDVGLYDGAIITDGSSADYYVYWMDQAVAWNDGADSVMWNNANLDVAQFGTPTSAFTTYTVETYGPIAGGLTFLRGYSLGLSTGGSELTLGGTNPVITLVDPGTADNIANYIYANLHAPNATTIQVQGHASSATHYSRLMLNGYNDYTGTLEVLGGGFVYAMIDGALSTASSGTIIHDNCMLSFKPVGVFDYADIHISGYGVGATAEAMNDSRAALWFGAGSAGSQEWQGNIVLDGDANIGGNTNVGTGYSWTTTISGVISGDHQLTINGPATLTLTAANTYTGGTRIYRGNLILNSTTGYAIPGDIDARSGTATVKRIYLNHGDDDGMPQLNPNAVITFDTVKANRMLFHLQGHTLTVGGISSVSTTDVTHQIAYFQNASNTNATLIVDNATDYSYRGVIRSNETIDTTGTLSVIKRGAGQLNLDGKAHQFHGDLTVEEGVLAFGALTANTSLFSPNVLVKSGATLDISAVTGFTLSNLYTGSLTDKDFATGATQVLSGGGTVVGDVAVAAGGSISPGESAGVMTFTNGVDFSTGGDYTWELGALVDQTTGVAGTDCDYLAVNGNVTLDGTSQLTIDLTAVGTPDEAVPFWTTAHSWKIIDVGASSVTAGLFTTLVNGEYEAGDFTTSVDASGDVFLNYSTGATVTLPGDATGDGLVNDLDAQRLASHWLQTGVGWSDGDFTGDGIVDDRDAAILAAHWVRGTEGASVPEPGTLALVAIGLLTFTTIRRRK